MAVTFNNATFSANQSTTGALALGGFTGTNLLSGAVPVTVNGTIDQPNASTVSLTLNVAGVTQAGVQGTYVGYSPVAGTQDYVYYFSATLANTSTPITIAVTPNLTATATAPLSTFIAQPVTTTAVTAPVGATPVCFVTGTRIRTVRGDVPVERLEVGDIAITASGGERPIVWIGHKLTDCTGYLNPLEVMPVRIRAGAFATNLPERDLSVSPGHRLFVDGALVHADMLVNGWSIVRDVVDEIDYWHVELDAHDVLIAEGLPAESYIDMGNRVAFEDGVSSALDLDLLAAEEGRCAPVLGEGPELTAIRTRLLDRARTFGARFTSDPGLSLVADGFALTPTRVDDERFAFDIPEGTQSLRLVSRASQPSDVDPACQDRRKLGVMVSDLVIDGHAVPVDGPSFHTGWQLPELADGAVARWTKGDAGLPIGHRLEMRIRRMPQYAVGQPEPLQQSQSRIAARLRAVA